MFTKEAPVTICSQKRCLSPYVHKRGACHHMFTKEAPVTICSQKRRLSPYVVTKFWPNVLMSIKDEPFHTVKVFMPKRCVSADIEDINTAKVALHLTYNATCDKTKSHILAIEKKNT
jgi:hypothetical protein